VVDCALELSRMAPDEVDRMVSQRLSSGKSLYQVDEAKLRALAPDIVVTQNLCQVCGPAGREVSQMLMSMNDAPKVVWQTPRTFDEVLEAVRDLGRETGTEAKADAWARRSRSRVQRIAAATQRLRKVRVSYLEWLDPLYCAGHWIPQMLHWAGAEDGNSRHGLESEQITWAEVTDYQPEVILVAPCGLRTTAALAQALALRLKPGWSTVPAVRNGKVYAVDANAYFARPGPRLVDGVELLAHLIHPDRFDWAGAKDAYALVSG
jgi:iron complex transport system substrate-binding protein